MSNEAVSPDEYNPKVQAGVQFSKPKDLKAATPSHPLYKQAQNRDILSEEEVEDGISIPWNVPATVLKNMSDGLYESEEATIREFESNAETASLKVERAVDSKDYSDNEVSSIGIVDEDYKPQVEITVRADKNKITIRDTGKGMEAATVLNVVRKIGATTVRDSGELTGQFGMGLASFLRLIGLDNSMIMRTHSRITDENFAAYVNLGGFDPIQGGLPEDQYGTEFEMIWGSDSNGDSLVDRSDLRDYVQKYSEWLRVDVHYEEYDEDGERSFDEDWGGKSFVDEYDDSKMKVILQKPDLFTAACSSDAEGETLLGSMPTDRNDGASSGTKKFDCPYNFDVRIEDESGAIAFLPEDGVNTRALPDGIDNAEALIGLTPVSDAEYNVMDPQQKNGHIRESEVPSGCVTLPVPTSSRDNLQENEEFWARLAESITDKFYQRCRDTYAQFDSLDDILDFSEEDVPA